MYFTCKGRYVYHSNFSYFRAYFVFVFLFIRQVKYCSVFILPLKYMSHVPTFPICPYKSSLLKIISFIATTSRKDSFKSMMVTTFFRIFREARLITWYKRTTFFKSLYLLLDNFRANCKTTSIKEFEASLQYIRPESNKWWVFLMSEKWI